jgi:NitT/TauT family transport system permease protein
MDCSCTLNKTLQHPALVRVFSLGLLLLLWMAAAELTADASVLPQPWALWAPFAEAVVSGALPYHLGMTLMRVVCAFLPAMAVGAALGFLMGRIPSVDRWLDPWLVVFLNLPALVLIVLCYLWIGLNETAAIIAVVLNKIPSVATILREGARALDPNLGALAQSIACGRWRACAT